MKELTKLVSGDKLKINLNDRMVGEFKVLDVLPSTIVAINGAKDVLYFSKECVTTRGDVTYVGPFSDKQKTDKFGQLNPFLLNRFDSYQLVRAS